MARSDSSNVYFQLGRQAPDTVTPQLWHNAAQSIGTGIAVSIEKARLKKEKKAQEDAAIQWAMKNFKLSEEDATAGVKGVGVDAMMKFADVETKRRQAQSEALQQQYDRDQAAREERREIIQQNLENRRNIKRDLLNARNIESQIADREKVEDPVGIQNIKSTHEKLAELGFPKTKAERATDFLNFGNKSTTFASTFESMHIDPETGEVTTNKASGSAADMLASPKAAIQKKRLDINNAQQLWKNLPEATMGVVGIIGNGRDVLSRTLGQIPVVGKAFQAPEVQIFQNRLAAARETTLKALATDSRVSDKDAVRLLGPMASPGWLESKESFDAKELATLQSLDILDTMLWAHDVAGRNARDLTPQEIIALAPPTPDPRIDEKIVNMLNWMYPEGFPKPKETTEAK